MSFESTISRSAISISSSSSPSSTDTTTTTSTSSSQSTMTLTPMRLSRSCDTGKEKALDVAVHCVKGKSKKRRKHNIEELLLDEDNVCEIYSYDSDDSSILMIIPPIPSQPGQRLPHDIVSIILQHVHDQHKHDDIYYQWTSQFTLYQCSLVSKQFQSIANPLLWRSPNLTHTATANRRFLRLVSNIPRTSSSSSSIFSPSSSPSLSPRLSPPPRRLPPLITSAPSTSTAHSPPPPPPPLPPPLLTLYQQRTLVNYIRHLELFGSYWTKARVALLVRLAILPHLTHLTVSGTTLMDDTVFHHLLRHWPGLSSLKLSHMYLTRNHFNSIAQYGERLVDLNLTVCSYIDPTWLVRLFLPSSALVNHDNDQEDDDNTSGGVDCALQNLAIIDCGRFMDASGITVIQHFDHLTSLTLTGLRHGGLIQYLLASLAPLTTPPSDPLFLLYCWPLLTTIELDPCLDLDDATWISFITTHTPRLQHVTLTLAVALSDISLDAMADVLPDLQSVTLNFNTKITLEGVRRFIAAKETQRLTAVTLVECQHIRPDGFKNVASSVDKNCVCLDQIAIGKIKQQLE